MRTQGLYIYGIVPNIYEPELFRSLNNLGVHFISFRNISAVFSIRETTDFNFSDRELLANLLLHHQGIIEKIMKLGFNMILPMKLGTIVNSKEDILSILENGYELILSTLKKMDNLTEIDMVVTWGNFQEVLKNVADDPDIIKLKNEILEKADLLSQIDQVKVGIMIQAKLKEKNTNIELNILDSLASVSKDVRIHEVMNDEMISNSAFLMNRNKIDKFEESIVQLDNEFEGALNFKLVGPLPCYSFFTLEIKELNPEHVVQAKKELGLREETSESEIKKAYLEKAKMFHPDTYLHSDGEEHFNKISRAYHTMCDYSAIARQSTKDNIIPLAREKMNENLILVKIKE